MARCRRHRCFPVLAGPAGRTRPDADLADHPVRPPEIAEQSDGALYDSREIDEILTLRVMTMTDEEKAQARATDPLAARIIDRCDTMSPEAMLNLHGVLRDPHAAADPGLDSRRSPRASTGGIRWRTTPCNPDVDAVLVNGVRVSRGQPRAAAARPGAPTPRTCSSPDKVARVTSVHETVDGETARRGGDRGRPGRRPARLVRPLPVLRA